MGELLNTLKQKWRYKDMQSYADCYDEGVDDCIDMIKKIENKSLFDSILNIEGLVGWTWSISPAGNMCWKNRKHIEIRRESLPMFLHEVAHALTEIPKEDATGHDSIWGDTFTELVERYLTK